MALMDAEEEKIMRTAEITRSTKETQITVWLSLDGGPVEISTGVGFLIIC